MDSHEHALLVELGRRTSLCWVRLDGRSSAVWHVWHGDALCLVVGGAEQRPAWLAGRPGAGPSDGPDWLDGSTVEVVMRSKDTGGRQLSWAGRVAVVHPEDDEWPATTAALVAARLNLPDPATAADRWARESTVLRIPPDSSAVVPRQDGSV